MGYDRNNKIFFFIGPSGSGKDTFFAQALERYQIEPIILLTTRPIRTGEVDGREYHFVTNEKMDLLEQKKQLIERRNFNTQHGIWSYATSSDSINLENSNYLTPNTWVGFSQFMKYFPKDVLIPIYFQLEDDIRLQRCLDRELKPGNGKYNELCRRFLADKKDFTQEMLDLYKPYIIDNNGTFDETIEQIDDILVRRFDILRK